MSANWRLKFCTSAVWNLLYVCQLATEILYVRSMELASCLPTGDWNFVGPQYGTCFIPPSWRLEFCGSAVWNLLPVCQLATGILCVSSMEHASCLPTGEWNFVGPQYGSCFMFPNWRLEFYDRPLHGATSSSGPVASRSHSGRPQSVGLPWTSEQPVAETSTRQHTTHTTNKHPCSRRDANPQSQQAKGP